MICDYCGGKMDYCVVCQSAHCTGAPMCKNCGNAHGFG